MPPLTTISAPAVVGAVLAACIAAFSAAFYNYWDVSRPPIPVILLLALIRAAGGRVLVKELDTLVDWGAAVRKPLFYILVVVAFAALYGVVYLEDEIPAVWFYGPLVGSVVVAACQGILRRLKVVGGNIFHPVKERQVVLLAAAVCLVMPVGISPEDPMERGKVRMRSTFVLGALLIVLSLLPRNTRPWFATRSHSD